MSDQTDSNCGTWPEQNAVYAWAEKYRGTTIAPEDHPKFHELAEATTKFRLQVQKERDALEAEVEALRKPLRAMLAAQALPCTLKRSLSRFIVETAAKTRQTFDDVRDDTTVFDDHECWEDAAREAVAVADAVLLALRKPSITAAG